MDERAKLSAVRCPVPFFLSLNSLAPCPGHLDPARIAQIVGKSVPMVSIAIADLKRFGLVEHFGSPKTGGYRISEKVEESIKGMDREKRVRIIMDLEDFRQLQIDFG